MKRLLTTEVSRLDAAILITMLSFFVLVASIEIMQGEHHEDNELGSV